MEKLQRTKLMAVILAAVVICCVFAACKKDPGDELSSTEGSSRSAWLDETAGTEETPPTEIVTDENGETKVVEYETDAQGEIATEADGKKVTKAAASGGKDDPATPVNGNTTTTTTKANGNTTTTTTKQHTTTTTTRPYTTTTTTTTQPAPPPPTPTELTAAQKQAMVDELFNYAKQLGFPQVTKSQLGEDVTWTYWEVTSSNIDLVLDDFKGMLYEYYTTGYKANRVNIYWGKEHPNRLFVFAR